MILVDNERRADLGAAAVMAAASQTNVHTQENTDTAIRDVLAYIAHFCVRCGLDPDVTFDLALDSFYGDYEDGPGAQPLLDPQRPLASQVVQ